MAKMTIAALRRLLGEEFGHTDTHQRLASLASDIHRMLIEARDICTDDPGMQIQLGLIEQAEEAISILLEGSQ